MMLENENYFRNILFQQERSLSFEKLIENNANNDVWGTNFSMIALSFLVKRPIISYTAFINSCCYTNIVAAILPFNYPSSPIKLYYTTITFLLSYRLIFVIIMEMYLFLEMSSK